MNKDYYRDYKKALKFSGADQQTVDGFLHSLNQPEHNHTRWGHGDKNFRAVAADALQDRGRDAEADLLRGGGHVLVRDGKVVKGQLSAAGTVGQLRQLAREHNNRYHEPSEFHHEFAVQPDGRVQWTQHQPYGQPLVHHVDPHELHGRVADELQQDLESAFNADSLNPEIGEPAQELIDTLRSAPFEQPAE